MKRQSFIRRATALAGALALAAGMSVVGASAASATGGSHHGGGGQPSSQCEVTVEHAAVPPETHQEFKYKKSVTWTEYSYRTKGHHGWSSWSNWSTTNPGAAQPGKKQVKTRPVSVTYYYTGSGNGSTDSRNAKWTKTALGSPWVVYDTKTVTDKPGKSAWSEKVRVDCPKLPTPKDRCGTANDGWALPSSSHITYVVNEAGTQVTATSSKGAFSKVPQGWSTSGGAAIHSLSFIFTDEPCTDQPSSQTRTDRQETPDCDAGTVTWTETTYETPYVWEDNAWVLGDEYATGSTSPETREMTVEELQACAGEQPSAATGSEVSEQVSCEAGTVTVTTTPWTQESVWNGTEWVSGDKVYGEAEVSSRTATADELAACPVPEIPGGSVPTPTSITPGYTAECAVIDGVKLVTVTAPDTADIDYTITGNGTASVGITAALLGSNVVWNTPAGWSNTAGVLSTTVTGVDLDCTPEVLGATEEVTEQVVDTPTKSEKPKDSPKIKVKGETAEVKGAPSAPAKTGETNSALLAGLGLAAGMGMLLGAARLRRREEV